MTTGTRMAHLVWLALVLAGSTVALGSGAIAQGPRAQAQVPSETAKAGQGNESSAAKNGLALLFGRIWRVSTAPSEPPKGSIYIFLSNGTLLETSCVETYRVATWTADKNSPRVLHVVEDKQPAFTATVIELTPTTMKLEQGLSRGHESHALTLTAIQGEFVCPDMPK